MTVKERLINEIDHFPEVLLDEVLDFLLFIKIRHTEEVTLEEQKSMIASQTAYHLGEYVTLDQYEISQT
jgi:hypothetical protein